jgi:hypothetical protein
MSLYITPSQVAQISGYVGIPRYFFHFISFFFSSLAMFPHRGILRLLLLGAVYCTAVAASLKPWEITSLSTSSPPGRPGAELPCAMHINITDPSNYPESSAAPIATCSARWLYGSEPYDQLFNCTDVEYGAWTFQILSLDTRSASPTQYFVLRFLLERSDQEFFEGSAHFAVGDNMRGLCSAGGYCSFSIKEEKVPFHINQTRKGG